MQTLLDFFGNKDFIPHGYCLNWNSALLWLHVVSDVLITLSYYSIPLSLAYFVRHRKDLPYAWLIAMGGVFIVACGTTHLMSAVLIWMPVYWLDGFIKAFTALISVATALAMLRVIPLILKLPTPTQLQGEIAERIQAQAALEIANARFNALFNNMHNGVAVYEAIDDGHDFIFRDFNHAGELLDHIKRKDLLNKPVTQVFPGIEQFGLLAVLQRVWQTGCPEHLPTSLYQDGRLTVYRENYVYRLPAGEVVAIYEDATVRKLAQQAQKEAAERLYKIANQLPSVVFQFVMRADGSFCVPYVSEVVRKTYRVSPEEIYDDATPLFTNVHPDDLTRHLEGIKKSAEQLSPWQDEYRLKFADGTERWLWGNALPQREADDSTLWHGFVMDITERKQVELQLQASEQKFRQLIEQIPLPLGLAAENGELIYINKRFQSSFGYSLDEIPTIADWYLHAYPDSHYRTQVITRWIDAVASAVNNGTDIEAHEYNITCKNGEKRVMLISGILFEKSLLATFVDITERKQMEQQLRDNDDFTNSILNSLSIYIAVLNEDGIVIAVNNAWRQCAEEKGLLKNTCYAVGVNYFEVSQSVFSQAHFNDAIRVQYGIMAVLAGTRDSFQLEYPCQERWFYMRVSPLQGRQQGVVVSHEDITQRKYMEEVLKNSESHLRTIIENEPECIKIVNAQGFLTQMNPAGLAMIEADSLEQVTGVSVLNLIVPEYRQAFAKLHKRVIAGETMQLEFEIQGLKGGRRWLETHAVPMLENNQTVHLAVTRDITKRKQAEQQLKELNRDFVTFLENTSDFIYFKDQNSRFRFCSQTLANITQHKSWRDLVGKHDFEVFPAETAKIYYEEELPVFEQGLPLLNKIDPYYKKDGSSGWVSTCKWPVFDFDTHTVIGIFGISRDITQLKQIEENLLRSNTDLEQFAYSVSHDMRQPLRSVTGHLQLLARSLQNKLNEDEQLNLNFALEGAKRMDAMILSLLDYSRIGRKTEMKTWLNSRFVLDEALDFLFPAIRDAKIEVKITGEWKQIFASHDELLRLLMNLIGNAVKYREENDLPWIEVDSVFTDETWKVSVRDYGIGINPTQIDRLFQFFSRLQSRTRFEGTGMGLALCRRIVEHHNGRIWVESAGEGQGCCFIFELPLHKHVES